MMLLFLTTHTAFTQTACDCTITPFKPDSCVKVCMGKILKQSSTYDLQLVLGLDSAFAKKITELKMKGTNLDRVAFSDFTPLQLESLKTKVLKLNEVQLNYLLSPNNLKAEILIRNNELDYLRKLPKKQ